jgi:hypothetical protein
MGMDPFYCLASGVRFLFSRTGTVSVALAVAGAFLFASSMTGCGLFSDHSCITVVLPDDCPRIEDFSDPESWTVSWLDEGGVRRSLVATGRDLTIPIPKERPCIITARPEIAGSSGAWNPKPAGVVLAACDVPENSVRASWEDGFAAWYLLRIAEAGIDPASVNVRRFVESAKQRGGERPWDMDLRRLGEHLEEGSLWVYSFRLSEAVSTTLLLPEGTWYPEYVPSEPLIAVGDGGWTGELGIGLHSFLRARDGFVAAVDIDERGEAAILFESP